MKSCCHSINKNSGNITTVHYVTDKWNFAIVLISFISLFLRSGS